MVQYKERGRGKPMTRVWLFPYACLMAADILMQRCVTTTPPPGATLVNDL
jgi:hypothetical protein